MQQFQENISPTEQPFPTSEETSEERLKRLIEKHKGKIATSFEELLGNGGMPDENADDVIKAVREWRDFPSNGSLD